MNNLSGQNYIGQTQSSKGTVVFHAENPENKHPLEPLFHEATQEEVDAAIIKAEEAFAVYKNKSGEEKAVFLEAIADEILALGDTLIKRACAESGLPTGRITGERGRTMNQLKLFASVLRDGSWVDARIDKAQPDRQPFPKVDIRSMHRPLGPVGIFGASNFPLAFSVAGGDTASALAAGCTIVVKGHPAHPGTCELIASAITKAITKCDMPDGTLSLLHGTSHDVGLGIVRHPLIQAVGFTGSFKGGKALFDAAQARPQPIPVYAEMGSTNPVFILPEALRQRGSQIASGLAGSVTLGVGQFCTNPGIVVHQDMDQDGTFESELAEEISKIPAATMLTKGIREAFDKGLESLKHEVGVKTKSSGIEDKNGYKGTPCLLQADAQYFYNNKKLEEEVFGPSTLLITVDKKGEMLKVARELDGHLTATIIGESEEIKEYADLINILERKVGRLIINGYPTGVEVCHAMVHGGPFPATTDSKTTSVGTRAMTRFSRPICFQNFPKELLPQELQDGNPLNIKRIEN